MTSRLESGRAVPAQQRLSAMHVLIALLLLVLIQTPYVYQFPSLAGWSEGLRVAVAVVLVWAAAAEAVIRRFLPLTAVLILALVGCYAFAAAMTGSPLQHGGELVTIVGIAALLFVTWGRDPLHFLTPACWVLSALLYINFATILLYPDGLYFTYYADSIRGNANWFLGYKNPLVRLTIPTLALCYIRDVQVAGRLRMRSLVLTGVAMSSVVLVGSTNGVIALTLFGLGVVLHRRGGPRLLGDLYTYVAVTIGFFVLVVLLRSQQTLEWLLVDYLHKDLTLVGRTYIWDAALQAVQAAPWFGTGSTTMSIVATGAFGTLATHPHNLLLYILMKGGVVGLAVFFVLIVRCAKQLRASRQPEAAGILAIALGTLLVVGLTESLTETVFFLPLVLLADFLAVRTVKDRQRPRRETRTTLRHA